MFDSTNHFDFSGILSYSLVLRAAIQYNPFTKENRSTEFHDIILWVCLLLCHGTSGPIFFSELVGVC